MGISKICEYFGYRLYPSQTAEKCTQKVSERSTMYGEFTRLPGRFKVIWNPPYPSQNTDILKQKTPKGRRRDVDALWIYKAVG